MWTPIHWSPAARRGTDASPKTSRPPPGSFTTYLGQTNDDEAVACARCSARDNRLYRASFTSRNHLRISPREILHDHRRRQPADSSPIASVSAGLRAADRGVASSLESVLADNTRRVYDTQWRLFTGWCDEVGLTSLPAEPLTVARYLAARAGSGASIATIRLATSGHFQSA